MIRLLTSVLCIALPPLTVIAATKRISRPQYEVVEIFEPGSDTFINIGSLKLNNSNLVVGVFFSLPPLLRIETFFWQPGQSLQWRTGQVDDINDAGAFIGSVDGTLLDGDGVSLRPMALNNVGQIAGQFSGRAFIRDTNGETRFPLGESVFSEARSINNFGEAAGVALLNPSGPFIPVIFTSSNVIDLGWIRGGGPSETTVINDQGHVLFTAIHTNRFRVRSYLYHRHKPKPLPSRPGLRHTVASAMNNFDEVVGYVGKNNSPVPRGSVGAITVVAGFLYSGGKLYDLNKLLMPESRAWHIAEARDINDSGNIVAFASRPGLPLIPVLLRRVQP